MFNGIEVNYMMFAGPLIVLFLTVLATAVLYALIFSKLLPKQIYKVFIGPVCLLGCYIWAIPMNLGFYEFFK